MLNYDTLGVEIKQPEICCTTAKEHPYNVSPNILFLRYDDAPWRGVSLKMWPADPECIGEKSL